MLRRKNRVKAKNKDKSTAASSLSPGAESPLSRSPNSQGHMQILTAMRDLRSRSSSTSESPARPTPRTAASQSGTTGSPRVMSTRGSHRDVKTDEGDDDDDDDDEADDLEDILTPSPVSAQARDMPSIGNTGKHSKKDTTNPAKPALSAPASRLVAKQRARRLSFSSVFSLENNAVTTNNPSLSSPSSTSAAAAAAKSNPSSLDSKSNYHQTTATNPPSQIQTHTSPTICSPTGTLSDVQTPSHESSISPTRGIHLQFHSKIKLNDSISPTISTSIPLQPPAQSSVTKTALLLSPSTTSSFVRSQSTSSSGSSYSSSRMIPSLTTTNSESTHPQSADEHSAVITSNSESGPPPIRLRPPKQSHSQNPSNNIRHSTASSHRSVSSEPNSVRRSITKLEDLLTDVESLMEHGEGSLNEKGGVLFSFEKGYSKERPSFEHTIPQDQDHHDDEKDVNVEETEEDQDDMMHDDTTGAAVAKGKGGKGRFVKRLQNLKTKASFFKLKTSSSSSPYSISSPYNEGREKASASGIGLDEGGDGGGGGGGGGGGKIWKLKGRNGGDTPQTPLITLNSSTHDCSMVDETDAHERNSHDMDEFKRVSSEKRRMDPTADSTTSSLHSAQSLKSTSNAKGMKKALKKMKSIFS